MRLENVAGSKGTTREVDKPGPRPLPQPPPVLQSGPARCRQARPRTTHSGRRPTSPGPSTAPGTRAWSGSRLRRAPRFQGPRRPRRVGACGAGPSDVPGALRFPSPGDPGSHPELSPRCHALVGAPRDRPSLLHPRSALPPWASVGAAAASSGQGVPRAHLPEDVVGLHATVLVARADHRHPQRRRRHGGGRPVRTLRLRAPTQSRLFRTSKMAAAAPGSHDAKRRRRRRIASGRAARADTQRPRGLPAVPEPRRRAEEGPASGRRAAGSASAPGVRSLGPQSSQELPADLRRRPDVTRRRRRLRE